jgi:hypothetical protein
MSMNAFTAPLIAWQGQPHSDPSGSVSVWARVAAPFFSLRRDSTPQEFAIQVGTPKRGNTQR